MVKPSDRSEAPIAKTEMLIRKPVGEVFAAFAHDPDPPSVGGPRATWRVRRRHHSSCPRLHAGRSF